MATYCLPSTPNEMGLALIAAPSCRSQSGCPVSASSAKKLPSSVPPNTRPPAVDSRPVIGGVSSLNSHFIFPLVASTARTPRIVAVDRAAAAADKRFAGLVFRLAFEIVGAHFTSGLIEELRLRAVRRARPVRRALNVWKHERAFEAGVGAGAQVRPAFRVQPVGPRLLRVRSACQKFSRLAIEHVVERVAIRHRD